MITREIWRSVMYNWLSGPIDYFTAIMSSFVTIPLDLMLSPFEIIGLLVYKICNK